MMKKKFIVLGGNGFIGNNFCSYISKKGHDVTILDKCSGQEKISNVHYKNVDFFDDYKLQRLISDKDIIVHAISSVNPGNSNEMYMKGYEGDLLQTIKMCSWIKGSNKKILFLSSGGTIYGEHDVQPVSEDVLPKPINHYANIKLSIENALRIFHIQEGLNISVARISNPYGPGQDFRKGVGFIDAVLKRALDNRPVEIWGNGDCIRDYIYIDDVCRFLYKLTQYNGSENLFNVSSGIGITQNEIIQITRNLGIKVNVIYRNARSVDIKKIVLDNKKIHGICNFKLISIEEGIQRYYEYLCGKEM